MREHRPTRNERRPRGRPEDRIKFS